MELMDVGQGATTPPLAVNSLVRAVMRFTTVAGGNSIGQVVLHYLITKVPAQTDLAAFMVVLRSSLFTNNWNAGLGKIMPVTLQWADVVGYFLMIDTATGDVVTVDEASVPANYKGALTNLTGVPRQCAALTRWTTARQGRSFRGRSFWPGIAKDDHTAGQLDGDAVTAMNKWADACTCVSNTGGTITASLAVFSRLGQERGGVRIPFATPVTNGVVDPILRTQRRRVDG